MVFCLTSANETTTDGSAAQLDHLLFQIASSHSEALGVLYRSTSSTVYAFALSISKNPQDAEDVLHDTYVNIYSAASSYYSAGKPMAWILTITRNLCLLKLRGKSRMTDIPPENWEPYLNTCESITPEDKLILYECMNRLSEEERQIVVLHAVAGFRYKEIASFMQFPLSTVLSKYHRAIKKLKNYLKKESENDDQ